MNFCRCPKCGVVHAEPPTIKCKTCGKVTGSGRGGKKFCSQVCRQKSYTESRREYNRNYQRAKRASAATDNPERE